MIFGIFPNIFGGRTRLKLMLTTREGFRDIYRVYNVGSGCFVFCASISGPVYLKKNGELEDNIMFNHYSKWEIHDTTHKNVLCFKEEITTEKNKDGK